MHEPKKRLYREPKSFFVSRKLYEFHSKPFFTHKNGFCTCLSSLSAKNTHFHKPKGFLLQKALRFALKSLSFSQAKHRSFEQLFTVPKNRLFTYKKPFIRTNLSLLLSKATLFRPPQPILTDLNLLSAKNTAVLLISALNPYAVKPESRTDSNHCRRYPATPQFSA